MSSITLPPGGSRSSVAERTSATDVAALRGSTLPRLYPPPLVTGPPGDAHTQFVRYDDLMAFAEDLVGRRFGRYVVKARAENRKNRAYWVCECKCGKVKEVMGCHLRRGKILSCGCLNREKVTATLVASNFKGEDIVYRSAHTRIVAARGDAAKQVCVGCGKGATDWSLNKAAKFLKFGTVGLYTLAYSTDPMDYSPRCRVCHSAYDRGSDASASQL